MEEKKVVSKQQLVKRVAKEGRFTQIDAEIFINAFIDVVLEALMEGEDVLLTGLGKFVLAERKERTGRDWVTGQQIVIPARKVPAFEFSKGTKDKIKEAVNEE